MKAVATGTPAPAAASHARSSAEFVYWQFLAPLSPQSMASRSRRVAASARATSPATPRPRFFFQK
eukprot:8016033-Lingulodinium_polyedra.AAC.1